MPITLNFTTLNGCENITGFVSITTDGATNGGAELAISDAYDAREGTDCLEWGTGVNATGWGGYRTPTWTAFDLTEFEFGVWFLLPKASNDETQILADGDDALKLRLYSQLTPSEQWGEYYIGGNSDLDGGWIYLRCSGDADRESATYDNTSIIAAAILTQNVGANNGAQKNGDAYYGMDWFKRYNKITVTGFKTGTTPYDLDDIYDQGNQKPFWGFPERTDIFYRFYAGLEFGDGTNLGKFADNNKYVYFDQSSVDVDYDTTIKNNYTVELGSKVVGSQRTYAINGVQYISRIGRPSIDVQSGGIFNSYACRIEGWNIIDLGGGGSSSIEIIKTDFYDNLILKLRSSGVDMLSVRMHSATGTTNPSAGFVFLTPTDMEDIRVFNVDDGLQIRANTKILNYFAGDTVSDLVIREGTTAILLDSTFDEDKLKRVT